VTNVGVRIPCPGTSSEFLFCMMYTSGNGKGMRTAELMQSRLVSRRGGWMKVEGVGLGMRRACIFLLLVAWVKEIV
jgi:hypothetical protein